MIFEIRQISHPNRLWIRIAELKWRGNSRKAEHSTERADQTLLKEEDFEPESIGSLLKCGLGYILCIDVIGLFAPKLYKAWFDEDPYEPIEGLEDFEADFTMIPFGPYLALGAIVGTVFEKQLLGAVRSYWSWAVGD